MLESVKLRLKKGDLVVVIAGKDKGKQGKISRVLADKNRLVIEGVNMITRHAKPNQKNPQGGRQTKESPIHASNAMLVDPKTGKPTRILRKKLKDGKTGIMKTIRVAKDSGTELN